MRPQGSWVKAAGFTVVLFAVGVGISLGRGRIGPHPLPPSTSWRSASASASVEFGLTPPPPWRTLAGCVPRLPSAPCIYKGHRPLPHPNHHTNLLPFESYLTNRIAQSDRMASAANVKLEDLGAAVDELDQISGSRAHHLVEHTSSSSVPSSVMDVQSLLPQAMTMSISTPELLLPLGEGTLDDVDDLLTRELRVPFLALGAAAAPYSGNGSDGGFAREHGMDAEQVKIDIPSGAANAAADADARGGNLASAVIGIAAASFAVTMLAAGAISPPLTFGLFVLLLGGLSLAVSGVRRS
ncbi:hypothetical protein DAI22_08g054900 [Oryza sativa Japonica Group]|nr:uncharacterized protein LOC107277247 isoform X2 [Oryza sativa Japonica Group]KAF2918403.1 hypothetical protein DAI22_08g054900 [Oryza sativa Japonica Group]